MVMVTAGETVTGTVQTRGADSVRLISNPSQGQATLETDGVFSYMANSGASGLDSFNYEAVNVNGVSDPATVFVDIESLVVIARDTSIVLPAGESVTFEVDSENATSWSLSLVDGEIPPVEFFPTVGFFPENPPGFITIETSDDAQGEFNLTYIARNGDVSDTGVISIFVPAEEEEEEEEEVSNLTIDDFIGVYSGTETETSNSCLFSGETTDSRLSVRRVFNAAIDGSSVAISLGTGFGFVPGEIDEAGNARFVLGEDNSIRGDPADFTITPDFNLTGTVTRSFLATGFIQVCVTTATFNLRRDDP